MASLASFSRKGFPQTSVNFRKLTENLGRLVDLPLLACLGIRYDLTTAAIICYPVVHL